MTQAGGDHHVGVAFRLGPDGTYTVLHAFGGAGDGAYPTASLIQDSAGTLYGTTLEGGTYGQGIVFELSPTGAETVLYNFTGGADGTSPFGGDLILDAWSATLYGTANGGGNVNGVVVQFVDTAAVSSFSLTTSEHSGPMSQKKQCEGGELGPLLRIRHVSQLPRGDIEWKNPAGFEVTSFLAVTFHRCRLGVMGTILSSGVEERLSTGRPHETICARECHLELFRKGELEVELQPELDVAALGRVRGVHRRVRPSRPEPR